MGLNGDIKNSAPGLFIFPRAKFVDSNSISEQLAHATSEMIEVITANDAGEGPERVAEETLDAMHSLESNLRILQEHHNIDVAAIRAYVERKNLIRGYYCD